MGKKKKKAESPRKQSGQPRQKRNSGTLTGSATGSAEDPSPPRQNDRLASGKPPTGPRTSQGDSDAQRQAQKYFGNWAKDSRKQYGSALGVPDRQHSNRSAASSAGTPDLRHSSATGITAASFVEPLPGRSRSRFSNFNIDRKTSMRSAASGARSASAAASGTRSNVTEEFEDQPKFVVEDLIDDADDKNIKDTLHALFQGLRGVEDQEVIYNLYVRFLSVLVKMRTSMVEKWSKRIAAGERNVKMKEDVDIFLDFLCEELAPGELLDMVTEMREKRLVAQGQEERTVLFFEDVNPGDRIMILPPSYNDRWVCKVRDKKGGTGNDKNPRLVVIWQVVDGQDERKKPKNPTILKSHLESREANALRYWAVGDSVAKIDNEAQRMKYRKRGFVIDRAAYRAEFNVDCPEDHTPLEWLSERGVFTPMMVHCNKLKAGKVVPEQLKFSDLTEGARVSMRPQPSPGEPSFKRRVPGKVVKINEKTIEIEWHPEWSDGQEKKSRSSRSLKGAAENIETYGTYGGYGYESPESSVVGSPNFNTKMTEEFFRWGSWAMKFFAVGDRVKIRGVAVLEKLFALEGQVVPKDAVIKETMMRPQPGSIPVAIQMCPIGEPHSVKLAWLQSQFLFEHQMKWLSIQYLKQAPEIENVTLIPQNRDDYEKGVIQSVDNLTVRVQFDAGFSTVETATHFDNSACAYQDFEPGQRVLVFEHPKAHLNRLHGVVLDCDFSDDLLEFVHGLVPIMLRKPDGLLQLQWMQTFFLRTVHDILLFDDLDKCKTMDRTLTMTPQGTGRRLEAKVLEVDHENGKAKFQWKDSSIPPTWEDQLWIDGLAVPVLEKIQEPARRRKPKRKESIGAFSGPLDPVIEGGYERAQLVQKKWGHIPMWVQCPCGHGSISRYSVINHWASSQQDYERACFDHGIQPKDESRMHPDPSREHFRQKQSLSRF